MLQMGTISVGTIQVEVTRARDILVGVAWWELSQHCLTLLRFSFGKFSMFKIKSKLFRTNKKVQQRFCSPHAFTVPVPVSSQGSGSLCGPGSCILHRRFWILGSFRVLGPPISMFWYGTVYYILPIPYFYIPNFFYLIFSQNAYEAIVGCCSEK